jgi:hypothetical protein
LLLGVDDSGDAFRNRSLLKPNKYETTKKVLVLKAPLTYILINEDRDSEQAKEKWLSNRELRLNPPKEKKDK